MTGVSSIESKRMLSRPDQTLNRLHPISEFQEFMLMVAQETDATSLINQEKTIRWAFRIKPALPPRALRRAFDKLVERHDSLRLRFVQVGGQWRAEILPKHPDGLQIEDLSHLPKDEQDALILKRSKEPITALSPTLFDMRLMRCGAEGDVLLTRLNHAVGDGYSTGVLIEDLLKLLFLLPLQGKAPGHADFLRVRDAGLRENRAEKRLFWEDHVLPLPDNLNIGLTMKGLAHNTFRTVGKTRRLDGVLPPDLAQRLDRMAKTSGVSSYCYLFAAFSETICEMGAAPQAMVKSAVSRHNAELANFIGCDVQTLVTIYTCDPDHLVEKAAWVSEHISKATAHLPTDAFDDGRAIDTSIEETNFSQTRFLVHMDVPAGRLKGSQFKDLFSKARNGKVTVGSVTLEQFPLPQEVETNIELMLLIDPSKTPPTAALIGNAEAYDPDELAYISRGIQNRLDQCC